MSETSMIVDIGNNHTVSGFWESSLGEMERIETHTNSKDLEPWIQKLLEKNNLQSNSIDRILIGSVVPPVHDQWDEVCNKLFGKKPEYFSLKNLKTALKMEVDQPETVGADRLANATAVWELTHKPSIVLDFGTATTLDVVNKDGAYEGGFIFPGVGQSVSSLTQNTAQLPDVHIEKQSFKLGQNTEEAITLGTYWGYVAMIEGLLMRVDPERKFSIWATGGWSETICAGLEKWNIQRDPKLTLKGIYYGLGG